MNTNDFFILLAQNKINKLYFYNNNNDIKYIELDINNQGINKKGLIASNYYSSLQIPEINLDKGSQVLSVIDKFDTDNIKIINCIDSIPENGYIYYYDKDDNKVKVDDFIYYNNKPCFVTDNEIPIHEYFIEQNSNIVEIENFNQKHTLISYDNINANDLISNGGFIVYNDNNEIKYHEISLNDLIVIDNKTYIITDIENIAGIKIFNNNDVKQSDLFSGIINYDVQKENIESFTKTILNNNIMYIDITDLNQQARNEGTLHYIYNGEQVALNYNAESVIKINDKYYLNTGINDQPDILSGNIIHYLNSDEEQIIPTNSNSILIDNEIYIDVSNISYEILQQGGKFVYIENGIEKEIIFLQEDIVEINNKYYLKTNIQNKIDIKDGKISYYVIQNENYIFDYNKNININGDIYADITEITDEDISNIKFIKDNNETLLSSDDIININGKNYIKLPEKELNQTNISVSLSLNKNDDITYVQTNDIFIIDGAIYAGFDSSYDDYDEIKLSELFYNGNIEDLQKSYFINNYIKIGDKYYFNIEKISPANSSIITNLSYDSIVNYDQMYEQDGKLRKINDNENNIIEIEKNKITLNKTDYFIIDDKKRQELNNILVYSDKYSNNSINILECYTFVLQKENYEHDYTNEGKFYFIQIIHPLDAISDYAHISSTNYNITTIIKNYNNYINESLSADKTYLLDLPVITCSPKEISSIDLIQKNSQHYMENHITYGRSRKYKYSFEDQNTQISVNQPYYEWDENLDAYKLKTKIVQLKKQIFYNIYSRDYDLGYGTIIQLLYKYCNFLKNKSNNSPLIQLNSVFLTNVFINNKLYGSKKENGEYEDYPIYQDKPIWKAYCFYFNFPNFYNDFKIYNEQMLTISIPYSMQIKYPCNGKIISKIVSGVCEKNIFSLSELNNRTCPSIENKIKNSTPIYINKVTINGCISYDEGGEEIQVTYYNNKICSLVQFPQYHYDNCEIQKKNSTIVLAIVRHMQYYEHKRIKNDIKYLKHTWYSAVNVTQDVLNGINEMEIKNRFNKNNYYSKYHGSNCYSVGGENTYCAGFIIKCDAEQAYEIFHQNFDKYNIVFPDPEVTTCCSPQLATSTTYVPLGAIQMNSDTLPNNIALPVSLSKKYAGGSYTLVQTGYGLEYYTGYIDDDGKLSEGGKKFYSNYDYPGYMSLRINYCS